MNTREFEKIVFKHSLSDDGLYNANALAGEAGEVCNNNRHKSKQVTNPQGRSLRDKTPVMGLYQRNGNITSKPVSDTTMQSLQPIIRSNVKEGSRLITDEWGGYNGLNKNYNHNVIQHGKGQYVIGDVHTNNLEGFWSLLKRGIIGIYHQVSEKHLEKYCSEFNFRYNSRVSSEADRIDKAISQCKGRLKYRELIGKVLDKVIPQPQLVQGELF